MNTSVQPTVVVASNGLSRLPNTMAIDLPLTEEDFDNLPSTSLKKGQLLVSYDAQSRPFH